MDNIAMKLQEMKDAVNGEVWLFSTSYTKQWTCRFEGKADEMAVKIEHTEDTLSLAVQLTYDKFKKLESKMPEFAGPLLEAPKPPHAIPDPLPGSDDDIAFHDDEISF